MKYDDLYPSDNESYILQFVVDKIYRAVYPSKCLSCKNDCEYITYAFKKEAIPVCSEECHIAISKLGELDD